MNAASEDQTDKEGCWISELGSLGIDSRQKNELNNKEELEALADNMKHVYYQDYKTAYGSGDSE